MRKPLNITVFMLLLLLLTQLAFGAEKFDLNTATRKQIETLPLTTEQKDAIWQRLLYEGPFKSIYELRELPEIDQNALIELEKVVRVNPPRPEDERQNRIEDAYYRIESLGTEEGTNVGLVDEWIDRLMEPMNVNDATIDELMDIQNVSPADAVAIYKQVKLQGGIHSQRDLRAIPGLSGWGYRNARNYLGYENTEGGQKLHGTYTFRAYNTPFFMDEELAVKPDVLVDPRPDVSHKLRFTYDRNIKAGLLWHRNLGEDNVYSGTGDFKIPEMKWFMGIERQNLGPVHIDRAYLGNYQISIGQGAVIESGDYFNPRYSGFGFDKRITGIAPDLSRSQEFTMRGGAVEGTWSKFRGVAFFSSQKKDAILNPDGSLNRLITMVPRIDDDIYPTRQKIANGDSVDIIALSGKQSMLNAVTEVGYGGEIAYRPWLGTSIGVVATEFLYDKPLKPDFGQSYRFAAKTLTGHDTIVEIYPVVDPESVYKIYTNNINSEILQGYRSTATSSLWSKAQSARRVFGINASTVVNNYTFQAEYGSLDNGSPLFSGVNPHVFIGQVHAQWSSLTTLAVFRDYSVGYDNPYCRSFANYARYKGTTYEDEFYLGNTVFAQLQRHSASPQGERGIYFETRYQISRPLTLIAEIDNWTRVPDQADYYRWVAKITYRPVFPISIRIRQKLQGRWNNTPTQGTGFQTYENRINLDYRLSRFDDLEIMYTNGYTRFTPRPRLMGQADPTGISNIDAQTASPSEAMGVQLTHNFSTRLKIKAAWMMYDGFVWNFEDTDFQVLQDKSARWWFSVTNRLSDQITVRFKLTGDSNNPKDWIQTRKYNLYPTQTPGYMYAGENATKTGLSFRAQIDYMF